MFIWNSLFFDDPTFVGNLISGSSAFSKSSLNIWKFTVRVLLKPGLENFEDYFTSIMRWVQLCGNLNILWHCLSLGLEWKLTFSSPVATAVFQICWLIECSTFTALSFRINSTGIPSPPLTLFTVMLPKAHLTLHSRMSGSRWLITPLQLSGSWPSFLYSSVYSCHLFLISSASVRSIPFLTFIEPIFAWNVPLVSLIFLKRSLVFPILLFGTTAHCQWISMLWPWLTECFHFCTFSLYHTHPYNC